MNFDELGIRTPEWDLILSASQKNNASEVLRLLVEEAVPPSHSNVVGQTGLHIAGLWGSVESMELLITAGADVNAQNQIAKMTPLHCAVRGTFQSFKRTHERRVRCVELLLQAGADATVCDVKGKDVFACIDVAIREAAARNVEVEEEMEEMRKVLRRAGARMSRLAQCVEAMDLEGVGQCLQGGEENGGDDATPMEVEKGLLAASEKFKYLLDRNDADGGLYESLGGIIKLLLEAGADPNACPPVPSNPSPLTEAPLHVIASGLCAARSFSPDAASAASDSAALATRELIARGAKISTATMDLLPAAARQGRVASVRFLIETVGVDPNYSGRQGMTALIFAARGGKGDIVRYLMEQDALDPEVADNAGKRAVDYATANKKTEIVELLGRRG